jgi:hypothetical protein
MVSSGEVERSILLFLSFYYDMIPYQAAGKSRMIYPKQTKFLGRRNKNSAASREIGHEDIFRYSIAHCTPPFPHSHAY